MAKFSVLLDAVHLRFFTPCRFSVAALSTTLIDRARAAPQTRLASEDSSQWLHRPVSASPAPPGPGHLTNLLQTSRHGGFEVVHQPWSRDGADAVDRKPTAILAVATLVPSLVVLS
ncbi:hypothetical protein LIA77_10813 [Sarocladium implicatum]|nr:hypothetical protein LIA77_10813 [Sarocladium implicatum]